MYGAEAILIKRPFCIRSHDWKTEANINVAKSRRHFISNNIQACTNVLKIFIVHYKLELSYHVCCHILSCYLAIAVISCAVLSGTLSFRTRAYISLNKLIFFSSQIFFPQQFQKSVNVFVKSLLPIFKMFDIKFAFI